MDTGICLPVLRRQNDSYLRPYIIINVERSKCKYKNDKEIVCDLMLFLGLAHILLLFFFLETSVDVHQLDIFFFNYRFVNLIIIFFKEPTFSLIDSIYCSFQLQIANIIKWREPQDIFLKNRNKTRLSPLLFIIVLEVLVKTVRQGNERDTTRKRWRGPSMFVSDG